MTTSTAETTRETHRRELAARLDLPPTDLPDHARLVDDLALDSLAMMSLLTWLESRGVQLAGVAGQPTTVGEVLSLLDKVRAPNLTVRISNGAEPGADFGRLGVADRALRPEAPADPLAPVLASHAIRLDPVVPDDIGFLYALASQPETSFRWRYRGAPPPFDRFVADLWQQVLVQYVARSTEDDRPVGHVVAYCASPNTRHVSVGAVFEPAYAGTGLAAHAVLLFVRYLFHTFQLHKLYLEVPGYNWPQLRSGENRLFRVEGVLRDHNYYAGRYWDEYVCAIYPDQLTEADR